MNSFLDPACVADTLSRLSRLQSSTPAQWGKMNAKQVICHLADSFRLGLGQRQVQSQSGVIQRTLVKTVALRLPLPWPKGIRTMPEADQQLGGTPPIEFASDMQNLVAMIQRFTNQNRDFKFGLHPLFAAMSEWEWMRWAYLHVDHHLRQFGL